VLIAGAGVAGVAAALECGRSGLRTALIEKTILPGGLATSGLVNVYLPLCDGMGRQVTFGVAEELLHLSIRYGPGRVPDGWRQARGGRRAERYSAVFSPASFVLALDEALEAAGVELWLDTLVTEPLAEEGCIGGVEVETKGGRRVLRAKCVIDATGDGDAAFRAGEECVETGNWLALWVLRASPDAARRFVETSDGEALLKPLVKAGGGAKELAPPDGGYRGTEAGEVTRFVLDGRRQVREHYKGLYASGEGARETHFPLALPTMAPFRTTRAVLGRATMMDGQEGRTVADSVGLVADWRKAGSVWEVP